MNAVLQAKKIAEQRKKPEQGREHPEHQYRREREAEERKEAERVAREQEEATRKEAERSKQEQTNTPRPAGAQYSNPQDQVIQLPKVEIKGKLFGDLVKNKNHKHLFSNSAGFTEVPTQLLYDMLKKLGFTSDGVGATSRQYLINNLIKLYDISRIEKAYKDVENDLNNAGYTGFSDGQEAVHGMRAFLQDTVKMYQYLNPVQKNDECPRFS
jgi:hypothetical protein